MKLKDKVSIITGGGKGIGAVTCKKFAKEGAKVVIGDIDTASAEALRDQIIADGGEAFAIRLDVTDRASVKAAVEAVLKKYGRIDVLVNNAGIIKDNTLQKMTDEEWDAVISINLVGTYNCAKAVVDTMVAQGSGVIINASSVVGLYGNYGQTNYAATKWAVIGMAKTWAKELGPKGIRACAVCPGFIDTPIRAPMPEKVIDAMIKKVPLRRLGKPEEIAATYAFLASDEASYFNGAALEVTGGVTL
jgi:3-oxoacyl-[acyl-carrier protein] reductase